MRRGMRDNWPIIVDTRVLSQNYSRTVARDRIQFSVASTLTGKKRDETRTQEGWMVKGRMRNSTEAWSLSWFFGFADPATVLLVDAGLRSLKTIYLTQMPAGSIIESQAINSGCWILFHEPCMRNMSDHFGKI